MRWAVFAVAALLGLVVDLSLADALAPDESRQIKPSLCGVLAVFVALCAPRGPALWGCFLLGLLLDLSYPLMLPDNRVVYLLGPHALGYAAGGRLVLGARNLVFRRRPLTLGVMTVMGLLAVQAVVVGVYLLRSRSWFPGGPVAWTTTTPLGELGRRGLAALYSGLAAVPLGWLLVRSMPLWGFQTK